MKPLGAFLRPLGELLGGIWEALGSILGASGGYFRAWEASLKRTVDFLKNLQKTMEGVANMKVRSVRIRLKNQLGGLKF